ncbi:MAG TPA: hypothetical protein VF469_14870 [Kofleriaceae bacterium]
MQPRQSQKRQLRSVKKLSSIAAASAPTSTSIGMRKLSRVRQQRADQGKKQPAPALAGAVVVTRPKVLVARLGQSLQHGMQRAIVARAPAGVTLARPDKVAVARTSQKSQLKTVRMTAAKAVTPSR